MSRTLPLSDFRAVRRVLEKDDFALWEGGDEQPPTELVDDRTWHGIVDLPDDVAIRTSDHNGVKLKLLYDLWGEWIEAIGDPEAQDELYGCMLDAADCFQAATFDLLHGYYRSALANLRTALELVAIGAAGNVQPTSPEYLEWQQSTSERFGFTAARRKLRDAFQSHAGSWILADGSFPASLFKELCAFTHSRPDATDGALWNSNGPVYNGDGFTISFRISLRVYTVCHLLIGVARPGFSVPATSTLLFGFDWLDNHDEMKRALQDIFD